MCLCACVCACSLSTYELVRVFFLVRTDWCYWGVYSPHSSYLSSYLTVIWTTKLWYYIREHTDTRTHTHTLLHTLNTNIQVFNATFLGGWHEWGTISRSRVTATTQYPEGFQVEIHISCYTMRWRGVSRQNPKMTADFFVLCFCCPKEGETERTVPVEGVSWMCMKDHELSMFYEQMRAAEVWKPHE